MGAHKEKYYFEFVGAHGAGKTFMYHVIAKQQLLKPHKAFYPGQMKRPAVHFALSCPILAIKNIRHIVFVAGFFVRYVKIRKINLRVLRTLIKMIILHPYYKRFDFDVLLKDDMLHMIQRIIFKRDVKIEEAFREYFMHFIYLYNGLIFVDIDPEIRRERFKRRFPGESDSFKATREVIHERAHQQSRILRRVVTTQTIVPFIVLDGGSDVKMNAQKAVLFINQII